MFTEQGWGERKKHAHRKKYEPKTHTQGVSSNAYIVMITRCFSATVSPSFGGTWGRQRWFCYTVKYATFPWSFHTHTHTHARTHRYIVTQSNLGWFIIISICLYVYNLAVQPNCPWHFWRHHFSILYSDNTRKIKYTAVHSLYTVQFKKQNKKLSKWKRKEKRNEYN